MTKTPCGTPDDHYGGKERERLPTTKGALETNTARTQDDYAEVDEGRTTLGPTTAARVALRTARTRWTEVSGPRFELNNVVFTNVQPNAKLGYAKPKLYERALV